MSERTSRRSSARRRFVVAIGLAAVLATGSIGAATALTLETSAKTYKNCTALNKVYPHGVGKVKAKDKVSGSSKPVTNFKKSNALYKANKKSDRDGDKIACEKR